MSATYFVVTWSVVGDGLAGDAVEAPQATIKHERTATTTALTSVRRHDDFGAGGRVDLDADARVPLVDALTDFEDRPTRRGAGVGRRAGDRQRKLVVQRGAHAADRVRTDDAAR